MFRKTGDIRIGCDDRKAVVLLNARDPRGADPEHTAEELANCFLPEYGEDPPLSFGRCEGMKSYNEPFDGLKPLK